MPKADIILANAQVINPVKPFSATTVAIKDDKILAVGGKEILIEYKGTRTKIIDCQRGALLPGFNDAHCHVLGYAASLLHLDTSPRAVSSIRQIQSLIKEKAKVLPPGEWITASGYDEFKLEEKRHPLRWDLDEAAPFHPVRLIHRTGKAHVLNSLALKMAGITANTEEPENGYLDRDAQSGEPNGLIFGPEDYLKGKLPSAFKDLLELEKGLAVANKIYLSCGLTSLQDASLANDLKRWKLFEDIKARGILASRIALMPGYRHLHEFVEEGFRPGWGDHHLRLGAVKIEINRARGFLFPEQEELERLIREIHRKGFQLALHSLEVETLEAVIKALKRTLNDYPRRDHRHRIEHCSLCPDNLFENLKAMKVMIVSQPSFLYYNGDRYLSLVTEGQRPWLYRLGSFMREGLKVAGSSDSPVAEPNPFIGLYAAIARLTEQGKDVLPLEGVDLLAALQMYTCNGAYASFEERVKGSIAPGKLADLILLKPGPFEAGLKNLKDIKVMLTMVGGHIKYEAH